MKKLLPLVAAMIIAATTFAQVDEVTLTVLGTGSTEEDATNIALRSAIEQSFGTFVSANTTILNDQLVKDEIVSVSNGNIKNYEKLAVSNMPNGQVGVSLRTTVSVNKLISYAKSKGSRAEFAGQTYAANVKLIKLKAASTKKAIDIMLSQMKLLTNDLFDFELTISEPYMGKTYTNPMYRKYGTRYNSERNSYIIPCRINVYSNLASTNFANLYYNTLKSLNLSDEEVRLCKNNQIPVTNIIKLSEFGYNDPFFDSDRGNSGKKGVDETLSNVLLPLSKEENSSFHLKIRNICINALRRVEIQEIGTNNTYRWKKKNIPNYNGQYVMTDNAYFKDFVDVGNKIGLGAMPGHNVFLLQSSEKKEFLLYDSRWVERYGGGIGDVITFGKVMPVPLNYFIVPITREPIELTKEQKKAQKKGTFTGKTYRDVVGKQKKLLSYEIKLYKDDIEKLNGYELNGVSAPQNK